MRRLPPIVRLTLLSVAGLLSGLLIATGTLATWSSQASAPGGVITAGNLALDAGAVTWQETSPDVAASPHVIDPTTFLVRQGDTFTVTYPFTSTLQGNNMVGEVSVAWDSLPILPAGATGSYQLLDADGIALTLPADLGAPVALTDQRILHEGDASTDYPFSLQIELDFAGLADRFGATSLAQLTDLGEIRVDLDQVREGTGFTP